MGGGERKIERVHLSRPTKVHGSESVSLNKCATPSSINQRRWASSLRTPQRVFEDRTVPAQTWSRTDASASPDDFLSMIHSRCSVPRGRSPHECVPLGFSAGEERAHLFSHLPSLHPSSCIHSSLSAWFWFLLTNFQPAHLSLSLPLFHSLFSRAQLIPLINWFCLLWFSC